jgi:regulator of protease activity HflC (stomatin/prohibitin superfamily)
MQAFAGTVMAWVIIGGAVLAVWGYPHYHVWQQGMVGEAELRRAEQNRKIAVLEAEAKKESARCFADAEIERAKGVAEANKIIGDSLHGNDDYLRYLWIQSLENGTAPTIVYVPTEAGLPILEAGRLFGRGHEKATK